MCLETAQNPLVFIDRIQSGKCERRLIYEYDRRDPAAIFTNHT